MAITFDPTNKLIILDSAYIRAIQIYSRWKEWVRQGDNSKYLQALSTLGGDSLGGDLYVASYFFLKNGWRIRPMEANHTLILEGNITVEGGGVPVVPTVGNYNVSVQFTVPVQAQGIATSGSSVDENSIAGAVVALLTNQINKINQITFSKAGQVDVNVKSISDKQLKTWDGTQWT